MSSVEPDLYGFLNLPPSRPLHQKRIVSASDRYPTSSLPVSKNIPKRPAADVIDQVHRRLSGNNGSTNGSPSSIPLFRVQGQGQVQGGLVQGLGQGQGPQVQRQAHVQGQIQGQVQGPVHGQTQRPRAGSTQPQPTKPTNHRPRLSIGLDNRADDGYKTIGISQLRTAQSESQAQSHSQPRPHLSQPQLHPQSNQPSLHLRNKQNLRTRASIIGNSNYNTTNPQYSNSNPNQNPYRTVSNSTTSRSTTTAATNSSFVNQKSRRRSMIITDNKPTTYATPPAGTHPSISSRKPDNRLSIISVDSRPGSDKPPPQPINSIRKQSSRTSLSPVPNGPKRLTSAVPPVPPIPDQIRPIIPRNRMSSFQQLNTNSHYIRPKRSFSSEMSSSHANNSSISSSISMNNLSGKRAERNSPQREYRQPHQINPQTNPNHPAHPSLSIHKSQTLPDIARLNLDPPSNPPSPGPKHQLSAKSPYRPLNMPARMHPRPNEENHSLNEPPDLNPSSQSKTVIGEYSLTKNNANNLNLNSSANYNHSHNNSSSTTTSTHSIRSKSTASKQWSTPRSNGQASVAATRRMLLSPYENFKRISQIGPASDYYQTPPPPPPPLDMEKYTTTTTPPVTNINLLEIKSIIKSLIVSKPDVDESNRMIRDMQAKSELVVNQMTPPVASKSFRLNIFEKGEILDFRHVYYCGQACPKKITGDIRRGAVANFGFDDEKGDYKITIGDHIAYRYRILSVLGKGSFGKVLKCIDHKNGKLVALKVIINRKRLHMQALIEADLLKSLSIADANDKFHVVKYLDHFNFRDHLCITTELLGINLYELIKFNDYKGIPMPLVRHFTFQLLEALAFLDSKSIIHCDLKPENVMLCDMESGKIKIIDFGSSCYESERVYTYIQSRFYRSPEVMLGMPYGRPVDMWSLGCIIPELLTGRPLFMGDNEQEQIACIMEVFGVPDKPLISKCARRRLFFDSLGKPRVVVTKRGEQKQPSSRRLHQVVKNDDVVFLDFLTDLLKWDPKTRPRPVQALKHEFITGKPPPPRATSSQSIKTSASNNSISSMTSLTSSIHSITPTTTTTTIRHPRPSIATTTGPRKQPSDYSYIRRG